VTLNLTFEQAAVGCEKDVLLNVSDTCPRCLGNKAEPGTRKVQCHHCGGTGMVRNYSFNFRVHYYLQPIWGPQLCLNHFTVLWILSRTVQVSWYQNKHSPTHTYPDHQSSFICFLHLLQSMASCHINWTAILAAGYNAPRFILLLLEHSQLLHWTSVIWWSWTHTRSSAITVVAPAWYKIRLISVIVQ